MHPLTPLDCAVVREEEMDAADLSDAAYARVLADLSRINTLTLAQRPTLAFVRSLLDARRRDDPPLRLLDVGFGQGDMLRAIARLARRMDRAVVLTGVDLNPRSAPIAAAATPADLPIRWVTGDYRAQAGGRWDAIISSLVAHHMTRDERLAFLRFMEAEAQGGWIINDLHRRRLPFVGYPVLATLAGVDPIVRRDGQLSIARSFRVTDWHAELAAAGVGNACITRWFPWRLVVTKFR